MPKHRSWFPVDSKCCDVVSMFPCLTACNLWCHYERSGYYDELPVSVSWLCDCDLHHCVVDYSATAGVCISAIGFEESCYWLFHKFQLVVLMRINSFFVNFHSNSLLQESIQLQQLQYISCLLCYKLFCPNTLRFLFGTCVKYCLLYSRFSFARYAEAIDKLDAALKTEPDEYHYEMRVMGRKCHCYYKVGLGCGFGCFEVVTFAANPWVACLAWLSWWYFSCLLVSFCYQPLWVGDMAPCSSFCLVYCRICSSCSVAHVISVLIDVLFCICVWVCSRIVSKMPCESALKSCAVSQTTLMRFVIALRYTSWMRSSRRPSRTSRLPPKLKVTLSKLMRVFSVLRSCSNSHRKEIITRSWVWRGQYSRFLTFELVTLSRFRLLFWVEGELLISFSLLSCGSFVLVAWEQEDSGVSPHSTA